MAVAVADPTVAVAHQSAGNLKYSHKRVTFDSSYPTGGEAITAAQFGLTRILWGVASVEVATAAAGGTVAEVAVLPQTDGSALLKCSSTTAEIANTTDLSALIVRVTCFGQG